MRYNNSIRFKLTSIMILIVGFVIYFTWFLNLAFSEQYYVASEKANIVNTFHKVKKILSKDQPEEDVIESLEQLSNSTNIKMMIAQSSDYYFTQNVIFTNLIDGSKTYEEILGYLDQIRTQIILGEENGAFYGYSNGYHFFSWNHSYDDDLNTLIKKGYFVTQLKDQTSGQRGIYLFGFTDDNYLMAMRVSIEGIKASTEISSRFLAYMGMAGIFLGSIIVFMVSTRFTKPIKEMAMVANQMTQLDFDAKIHLDSGDELEELGNSMNQMSETLEKTIADLKAANLELQKDIEKKEQIDEMRKEFLSHVSHELKTPIALIQGYAEGLRENIIEDEESKDFYCEVISDEAQKMNVMVKKLLTLNQIEFGNNQLDMQRFDICQLIQNKIQASQILFVKKNNQVIFDEKGPVYVWADEFMIEEVFSNYLSNALNHVFENGTIRIWFERKGKDLRIHVYNDGNQIPEKDLEKLWIKFYKVDKARTREYGGSGIGLSIVAATMNAHGKQFGVANQDNGVDFYFDLDAASQETEQKK
ncbi:MAG: HAMP domain-containing histidine kinase [Eubacterium sp.]|nr:HAMP domain-containing histidine kinase [Eubacterium sp.]